MFLNKKNKMATVVKFSSAVTVYIFFLSNSISKIIILKRLNAEARSTNVSITYVSIDS